MNVIMGFVRSLGTAAAVAAAVFSAPAMAACNGGVCLYEHNYYAGAKWQFYNDNPTFAASPNDKMSSLQNVTPYTVCFYEHWYYGGITAKIGPWTAVPTMPSWFNDKASSMRFNC